MKLWHCENSRSLRPLWALEEIKLVKPIEFELITLPFPPRVFEKSFLEINELGTVPFFQDGHTTMTESTGICHYLVDRFDANWLAVDKHDAQYGDYLNWLYHSDATLTFPQTLHLRYTQMEPPERQQPQVADDYRKWFHARLRRLNNHLTNNEYLTGDKFTIADICVGYALYLGRLNGFDTDYTTETRAYLDRLVLRPGFINANAHK